MKNMSFRSERDFGERPEPPVRPFVVVADNATLPATQPLDRLEALRRMSPTLARRVGEFLELAKRGLPQMYADGAFAHTVRLTPARDAVAAEGDSLRYAVNVGLGVSLLDETEQKQILKGDTAQDVIVRTTGRAEYSNDPGAVALAAWTSAEASEIFAEALFRRLTELFLTDAPINTVDTAWALMAAVSGHRLGDTAQLLVAARDRLLAAQSPSGLFPHTLPATANGRMRAHVGSFADQVYPIEALSRLYALNGDKRALQGAEAAAARICALQGPAGQWWWHYDTRDGSVVEGYPVYSVHQHAMGPMALLDLREAGGTDHMASVVKGLGWLDHHPEVREPMVSEKHSVIWRKAARREPRKMVRAVSALTTRFKPGLKLPGLDILFPPARIDHECRPYEFGWMLYAWLGGGAVLAARDGSPRDEENGRA
ncbi:hypothetical protein NGM99_04910 [Mesorhizobium sp. RP14(2022)]|uniref:Uncharacterized protein n=1 Tax=Mesorhizobium liriopis TaxID=2953882 RepID=A0ABT1C2R8_9HYPH|nr:hypothetical protein [Mesorhizobium liriopis]MCO6049127.1 hypothetical protein [Mesorhizobium liriopis]